VLAGLIGATDAPVRPRRFDEIKDRRSRPPWTLVAGQAHSPRESMRSAGPPPPPTPDLAEQRDLHDGMPIAGSQDDLAR